MSEDNTIPRNLTDSLFRDFDLPQVSHITPKNNNKSLTLTQSKYQDAADDDFLNVQLGQNSHIVQKKSYNVPSNNSSKSKIIQQEIPIPATVSRVVTNTRAGRRKPAKKAQPERKQIDIDNEIGVGEIAEWAEKGAKNNIDDEQFNQAQKVGETALQIEIKKKLSEKLKTGFNNKSKTGGGGLLAKAAQLKKQNQTKTLNSDKPFSADQLIQETHQRIETKAIYEEHQTSTEVFMANENTKAKPVIQNEQSEDDPWQKVNQNTLKQQNQAELKRKNMNYESVVLYYQNEFQFNEEDIEIEENNAKEEPRQEKGCFQMLFACFKDQPKKNKKSNASNNTKLAKRLIAISKKQLSNGEEEFFVLKQIWTQLTGDPFARHGSHWNKIGFQGRDPTTDLRSTGVLSILQWFIFIQNHKKLAKQYAEWSIENQFPLALTHIKITGIFLQLIEKGAIRGQNWSDFQRSYNSMAISIFKKLKSTFKGGDILGTRVQQQVKNTKKSYPKDLQVYNQQHKK